MAVESNKNSFLDFHFLSIFHSDRNRLEFHSHMTTKVLVSFNAGILVSRVTQNLIIDHWLPATNNNCLFNWNLLVV